MKIGITSLKTWARAIRVHQWIKNLLVFAALIFAERFFSIPDVLTTVATFFTFSLLASSMYLFNDIEDVDSDRHHPLKKHRPIASGVISISHARFVAILFIALSLVVASVINVGLLFVLVTYGIIVISYSKWLKKKVMLDMVVVSLGFVLRALAGAVAIQVEVSVWLLVTTLFLALFLVIGKRRAEFVKYNEDSRAHRTRIADLSESLLDQVMMITATATLVSYTLYVLWPDTIERFGNDLVFTLPLVIYALFRYLYLSHIHNQGAEPTKTLLTDRPIIYSVILWGCVSIAIIYLHKLGFNIL